MISCDISWKAMLGTDERDVTEEEIAALEAEHGPFLPADGEGVGLSSSEGHARVRQQLRYNV